MITPFMSAFVGAITADGQTARVAAIAASTQGGIVLLNLVANDITLSATTARLFKGEKLLFGVADTAPLGRAEPAWSRRGGELSPDQGRRARTPARKTSWCCRTPPISARASRARTPSSRPPRPARATPKVARPPRFIFANHDETAPHARAFLGHLRALRVVFLPHWADLLWMEGLAANLITPLPALGVRAWQIASDQQRWAQLISEAVSARRMARHAQALTA